VVLPDVGNAERRMGPHCPTHHGELAEEDAEEGGLTTRYGKDAFKTHVRLEREHTCTHIGWYLNINWSQI
jgi:hypothetical protein